MGALPAHAPRGGSEGWKQGLWAVKSQATLPAAAVSVGSPGVNTCLSLHPALMGARSPTPTQTGDNDPLA